ncbi:MAG TPA: hypothetical protein VLC79_03080 [Cellvibrio sp.]|nr:hypothetical protein [Cellvibrio sp.]
MGSPTTQHSTGQHLVRQSRWIVTEKTDSAGRTYANYSCWAMQPFLGIFLMTVKPESLGSDQSTAAEH